MDVEIATTNQVGTKPEGLTYTFRNSIVYKMSENEIPGKNGLGELRNTLVGHFNESELKNLCQDLSIDYESLGGQEKGAKARELVNYCQRHGLLTELTKRIRELRPRLDLSAIFQESISEQHKTELSPFKIGIRYDEKGKVTNSEIELIAIANEAIYFNLDESGLLFEVEFVEIEKYKQVLEKYNKEPLTSVERIQKTGLLDSIRYLEYKKQKLIKGLDIIFSSPLFNHLRMPENMALIFKGLGTLILNIPEAHDFEYAIPLDLYLRNNTRISTVIYLELSSEVEVDRTLPDFLYGGSDIFHLPGRTLYEYGIPAIALEYLRLKEKGENDDLEEMLNLYNWNAGLH